MKYVICEYFKLYDSEPYFKPTPICTRALTLKEAIDATNNCDSCEYKKEIDLTQISKNFIKLAKTCEKMKEVFRKIAKQIEEEKIDKKI